MIELLLNLLIVYLVAEATAVGVSLILLLLGNNDPLGNEMFERVTGTKYRNDER
ncbi:MAG: hypothetical protein VW270_29705 [Candidatus Poseidoniales archaeon]